jgi:MFS family permease
LNTDLSAAQSAVPVPHRAFAALSNPSYRVYFLCASAALMADNIEHVISYWVIFEKFHSAALAGFAVISHWVPYLFLAGYTGALADRFDIRRLIQLGMALFMGVSICWGVMFYTDSVMLWKAMLLLIVHGLAGVIWIPASQVLINRIVGPELLPSAVRMTATGRYLAFVVGPAVGSGLMLLFGPTIGIFINAAIYLPLFVWLIRAPFGRLPEQAGGASPALRGVRDILATMRVVVADRVVLSMTILAGATSFFVGNSYQAQMPRFAFDLGHGRADFSYSVLLAADAAGGLIGGVILESRGLLRPKVSSAYLLAIAWCVALTVFAISASYLLSILVLFAAGFLELSFNAMAQTLVQLKAPSAIRGRVIGVFTMSGHGLRTFSGLNVGLLGAAVGVHRSLAFSAASLCGLLAIIFLTRVRVQ